jgi:hypothetical protein
MCIRNNLQLIALISCSVALSGCFGSDKKSTTNAAGSGASPVIIDTTAPAITITGGWLTTVELGSIYVEQGASAVDDFDGSVPVSISGSVDTSVFGTYPVTYSSTDSAGNTGFVVRQVTVADTIDPVITLAGSLTVELLRGELFIEPGATAVDSFDGEIAVEIEGSVDITKAGVYTLTYNASDSSGNSVSEIRTITVLYRPILHIQSKNYFTGTIIQGAEISVSVVENGNNVIHTGLTDASGELIIILAEDSERIVVSGDADGYGEFSKIVLLVDKIVDMFLPPVNEEVLFAVAGAVELEVSGLSIVTLPANSLVDENGNPAVGEVSAELTLIDPSIDPNLMSGNYEIIESGVVGHIESFGAINVTFDDANGNSYNLAPGKTATVRIPLASGAEDQPNTIPLYHFDKITGYWIESGTAALTTVDGKTYYEGTVSQFATWNADTPYEAIQINGCVQNSLGNAVTLAEIQTQGVTFSGKTVTTTDIAGNFSIAAKPSSTVLLSATTARSASRTTTINTGTIDINQAECIVVEGSATVITLTWGEHPHDLDTQFFGPSTEAGDTPFLVFYSNIEQVINESTISLDVDDVDSFGPEITTISSFPFVGRYSYAVNHFSGSSNIAASPARVELNYEGERQIFSPPEGAASKCWAVFDFVVDREGEITVEPIGKWKTDSYCSAAEYTQF